MPICKRSTVEGPVAGPMYRILTSWQPCIESHWRSCLGVIHFLAVSRFIHASYVLSTRAYYLPHDVLVEGVCWSLALIYIYLRRRLSPPCCLPPCRRHSIQHHSPAPIRPGHVLPNCESVKEKSQLTLKMCICASLKLACKLEVLSLNRKGADGTLQ